MEYQEDVDTLVRGIKLTRAIMAKPALADILNEELLPGASIASDTDLENFARQYARTACHPVGTRRMGNDDLAVVDSQLKLRDAQNIWISDASVMPKLVSGNTNAPTIMIGERAAEFILRSLT